MQGAGAATNFLESLDDRRRSQLTAAATAALCLWALAARWHGINPASFDYDGQWVGIVLRKLSWAQYFELHPTLPPGFVGLQAILGRISGDPEWPLQILPLFCSLLQIPLMVRLSLYLSGRRSIALLAGALIAVSPFLSQQSVTPKPLASDGVATLLILLMGLPLLQAGYSLRRGSALAVGGLAALVFSSPSVFVSASLVNLAALRDIQRRNWREAGSAISIALAFDLLFVLFAAFYLRQNATESLQTFWSAHFLPLDSWKVSLDFLAAHGIASLTGAFHPHLAGIALASLLGIGALAMRESHRWIAVYLSSIYLQLLAASALRLYPMGVGRAELFLHPITITLAVYAVHALLSRFFGSRTSAVLVSSVTLAIVFSQDAGQVYQPKGEAALAVAELEEIVKPGDTIILYPLAAPAVGYYGAWPVEMRQWTIDAHGLDIEIGRPETHTLPAYRDFRLRPARLEQTVKRILESGPPRVLYFAAHAGTHPIERADPLIRGSISRHGYQAVDARSYQFGDLVVYERTVQD